ncbi:MAG: hypothetical protein FWG31_02000 [Oscillospiraceae bacterium]|nr:hypothetical protein [Oscillospiraceae bacterium]
MELDGFELAVWIYQKYGRVGSIIAAVLMIAFIAAIFIFLNSLPERKGDEDKGE